MSAVVSGWDGIQLLVGWAVDREKVYFALQVFSHGFRSAACLASAYITHAVIGNPSRLGLDFEKA